MTGRGRSMFLKGLFPKVPTCSMGSSVENSHMHITHPWVDFMSTREPSGTCKTAAVQKVYNLPSKPLPSPAERIWWR